MGEYAKYNEENGYVAYDMTEAERYAEPAGDWVRELRTLRESMSDLMGEIDDECGEAAPRLDMVRENTEKMIDAAQAMLRKVDQLYRDSHM